MLIWLASAAALVALFALLVDPLLGVLLLFIARPLVDTTWAAPLIGGFKLTEIVSTLVPLLVLLRMAFDDGVNRPLRDMPLRRVWLLWSAWVACFAAEIMFAQGLSDGANVMFRHLNGLAGFYMVQAYCREPWQWRRFAWALALAGVFPITTGLIEAVTGHHWSLTYGEDGIVRNIGLYHDAITIRYFAMQTLLGLLLIHVMQPRAPRALQLLLLAYGAACLVVVQGAYSKSGSFTVLAWAVMWLLLRRQWKLLLAAATAGVAAVAWYSAALMKSFGFIYAKELAAVQGQSGTQRIFAGRMYVWQDMLDRWRELSLPRKLLGSGEVALGAHNDYLQILFHGGIVGLALYVALLSAVLLVVLRQLRRQNDAFATIAAMALLMWLVDTIGLVPSAYSGYQWFVWGVIGLCLRQRLQGEPAPQPVAAMPATRFTNLMGVN